MPVGFFLVRANLAYVIGVALAAAITSLSGGSTVLLIFYSLVAGFPFLVVALVLGLVLRRFLASHLFLSAAFVPVVTGFAWWGLGLTLGELFDAERVAAYAVFCAALSSVSFCLLVLLWPPPSSRSC